MSGIAKVGVVGCGTMGAGFAESCVLAGVDVVVAVSRPESVTAGRERILASMDRAARKGRLTAGQVAAAGERLTVTADLDELGDRDLVLEAVPERESLKAEVFAALDKITDGRDTILASITSSIPIVRLARATSRPGRVIGLHFFNPVPALPLVELVGSLLTDEQVCARSETFVSEVLGKQVIRSKDRAGFVVNALLIPYLLAAVRMVESGFSTAADIDRGMTLGCAHPMGPLALIDLIGVDTVVAVGHALYDEFKEPLFAPPASLVRMAEAGLLGKKTGTGFYEYPR
ncbi:3-hydroxybutyryl-CoA dehydrogenase [Dactylosporangium sp. CA-152071]|uniref:3-hydroxybutyryl-CoA dehydrogenase n=1 Tax=Dactylosporangium sp. CA-152071 TaxID=3239933 RepID=UPI003D8DA546